MPRFFTGTIWLIVLGLLLAACVVPAMPTPTPIVDVAPCAQTITPAPLHVSALQPASTPPITPTRQLAPISPTLTMH